MKRIAAFALSRRLLVIVLTLLAAALGVRAYLELPIDAFPDVSVPQVKVIVKAPGMTPEEVENRITVPIEQEMLGIPRERIIRAVSKYALTDVTIDFEDGTDVYWARQQVAERLAGVMKDLPPQASGGLAPITTPLGEMFMFTIDGPQSLAERRALLDWVVRPQLRTIRGVADVNSLGGHVRSYEIVPDVAAMNARGVTLSALEQALADNNRNDGAGRVRDGEETLLVRAEGAIGGIADLEAIVVGRRDGVPIRLADVAMVRIGSLTRYGFVTHGGKDEAIAGLQDIDCRLFQPARRIELDGPFEYDVKMMARTALTHNVDVRRNFLDFRRRIEPL